MKAIKARVTKGIPVGAYVETCDNSGAKLLRVISVKASKTVKGRIPAAGIGDLIQASVKKGKPEMRKQVVYGIVVRQKKD